MIFGMEEISAYAVSYTHLDVYKRQCLLSVARHTYKMWLYINETDAIKVIYLLKLEI